MHSAMKKNFNRGILIASVVLFLLMGTMTVSFLLAKDFYNAAVNGVWVVLAIAAFVYELRQLKKDKDKSN